MTRIPLLAVRVAACAAVTGLAPCAAVAQADTAAPEQVVVTGSVTERAAVDAPYAISVIDAATLRSSGPLINLSEAMAREIGRAHV